MPQEFFCKMWWETYSTFIKQIIYVIFTVNCFNFLAVHETGWPKFWNNLEFDNLGKNKPRNFQKNQGKT